MKDKRILVRMVRIMKLLCVLPRYPRHPHDLECGAGQTIDGLNARILPNLHGAWVEFSYERPQDVSDWLQSCVMFRWTCWGFEDLYTGREMPPAGTPMWYRLASKPEPIPEGW